MKTYFIDIDGTLLKHHGSVVDQIKREPEILSGVLNCIKEWDRRYDKIILVTGRKESMRRLTESQLENLGIVYDTLLMGVGSQARILINDLKPSTRENALDLMAHSINVTRNEGLDYLKIDQKLKSENERNKCVKEYYDKLESQRDYQESVSGYLVNKPWGWEKWLDINEYYVVKMIHMNEGYQSSLQSHDYKLETNVVIDGEARVLLEQDDGLMKECVFRAGEGWRVLPGQKHRVIAQTDYTAIETSTPHLDDVRRYEDDSNRQSGKIDDEHR